LFEITYKNNTNNAVNKVIHIRVVVKVHKNLLKRYCQ